MAAAFGLGLGMALYLFSADPFGWTDGSSYWDAAGRLRDGEPLYIPKQGVGAYLYAPWFAWLWVPLTHLPEQLVIGLWRTAMVVCAVLACLPAWRYTWGKVVVAYGFPLLLVNAIGGNVQPAVVAMLAWIPWSTGIAASIKPLALGLVVIDAWHRRWASVALAIGLAVILWMPVLLYDLSGYPAPRGIAPYDFTILLAAVPRLQRESH